MKKELNQWIVSYLMCSILRIVFITGIRATPYRVHFGRAPADLSVDMTLPKEVVERLETEDNLCGVMESRQVIGDASFDPAVIHPEPRPIHFPSPTSPCRSRLVGQKSVGLSVPLPMMKYPRASTTPVLGCLHSNRH